MNFEELYNRIDSINSDEKISNLQYRIHKIIYFTEKKIISYAFSFAKNKVVLLIQLKSCTRDDFDLLHVAIEKSRRNNPSLYDELEDLGWDNNSQSIYYAYKRCIPLSHLDFTKIEHISLLTQILSSSCNYLQLCNNQHILCGNIDPVGIFINEDNKVIISDIIFLHYLDVSSEIYQPSIAYKRYFSHPIYKFGFESAAFSIKRLLLDLSTKNYSKIIGEDKLFNIDSDSSSDSMSAEEWMMLPIKQFFSTIYTFTGIKLPDNDTVYRCENMPTTNKVALQINTANSKKTIILHINHYLTDILELNKLFASLSSSLIYIAIPYSNYEIAPVPIYKTLYANVDNGQFFLKDDKKNIETVDDFSATMDKLIDYAIEEVIVPKLNEDRSLRLLIVEDGGFHYVRLDKQIKKGLIDRNRIIGSIEQTASGVRRCLHFYETNSLNYPVLTVARSNIKMRMESFFVARRVIDELNYLLYMADCFLSYHTVVVIGYGSIGRNLALSLKAMKCNVYVYDISEKIIQAAKNDGFTIVCDDNLFPFTDADDIIIIGATGNSSFTFEMLRQFICSNISHIYLASASSKRVEFQSVIEFFDGSHHHLENEIADEINSIKITRKNFGTECSFIYNSNGKSITLIADGYPVNFYRKDTISLTYSIIDLINAEIVNLVKESLNRHYDLRKEIYFLGDRKLPLDEAPLLAEWFYAFKRNINDVWTYFDIHPCEEILRSTYMKKSKE